MTVRSNFGITSPDKTEFTLEVTMTLAEWRIVRKSFGEARPDPVWHLVQQIDAVVQKAENHFVAYQPKPVGD